jgi:arginine decarboxylase
MEFQLIPRRMFFTRGVGKHHKNLQSFEIALRNAGIAQCNLVKVSSIFPAGCKIVSAKLGLREIAPGQITFLVLAEERTNEPNRLISAGIGLAIPAGRDKFGGWLRTEDARPPVRPRATAVQISQHADLGGVV